MICVNFTYQLPWRGNYLYLETDAMTVCYLKLFRNVAFDNFIVQRQILRFFLEKSLLSDRKFANSIYPRVNEIDAREFFFFFYHLRVYTNCRNISRNILYERGWKRIEDSWKGISKVENSRVLLVAFLFYAWKHRRAPRMTSFASSWKPSTTREENRKVFANFPYFPSINNFLSDSKNHL